MKEAEIYFDRGTLLLKHFPPDFIEKFPFIKWDERTQEHRAIGMDYREIVLALRRDKISYLDKARDFQIHEFPLTHEIQPRSYQKEALTAWTQAGSQGVVTLPTGAGKTILAVLAIAQTSRPTLVHVPTIDLMQQWYTVLKKFFGVEIGLLGGGYNSLQPITVATYDSALIHVPFKGNRFGLAIFDECHHLPSEQLKYAAMSSIAPFRLGLTATPDRPDGKEALLYQLTGALCYEAHIRDLEGSTLAPYEVVTVEVEMQESEMEEYDKARQIYVGFLKSNQVDFGAGGWNAFVQKASRSAEGRQAFRAYLLQKKLSQASAAKEKEIWDILIRHAGSRVLIFTQDNEMAYRIGRNFLLPVLTHHTKVKEREGFLKAFREGEFSVLVTSKVLNEGVDVPDANVAIVVSGSGTVREHVQRLGRILRAQPNKKAILYELISAGTAEYFVNKRRRQHSAYQKSP